MSDAVIFPAPEEGESAVDYWGRVQQQLGLPAPWERSQALPPGEVEITQQWATKDHLDNNWLCANEVEARRIAKATGTVVTRRIRWESAGLWEEVT